MSLRQTFPWKAQYQAYSLLVAGQRRTQASSATYVGSPIRISPHTYASMALYLNGIAQRSVLRSVVLSSGNRFVVPVRPPPSDELRKYLDGIAQQTSSYPHPLTSANRARRYVQSAIVSSLQNSSNVQPLLVGESGPEMLITEPGHAPTSYVPAADECPTPPDSALSADAGSLLSGVTPTDSLAELPPASPKPDDEPC